MQKATSPDEVKFLAAANHVRQLLHYIGEESLDRDGIKDTPSRVVKSYAELFSGYRVKDTSSLFTTFDHSGDGSNGIILLRNIEFYSFCEHHMLPFTGIAHIAYVPSKGRIVGISKLARLLEVYSRRLQVQERIGQQVVDDLVKHLQPIGAACVLVAKHACMTCRGVNKQHSEMVTSVVHGCFDLEISARAELMQLIKGV